MASVLSAGTTSNTALNLSADTTGILQFQTNGTTAAMTIDTSQNVGIGTASPNALLTIAAASTDTRIRLVGRSADGTSAIRYYSSDNATQYGFLSFGNAYAEFNYNGSGYMFFATNNTERMRITSGGNVGIGNSSPNNTLSIQAGTASVRLDSSTGTNAVYSQFVNTGGSFYVGRDNSTGAVFGAAYASVLFSEGAYPMNFYTAGTERMRIDSSGNLLVGTTSYSGQTSRLTVKKSGNIGTIYAEQLDGGGYNYNSRGFNNGGTYYHMQFEAGTTQVGIITSNGSNTTYGTGSDYRLKDDVARMVGALDKVQALNPVTWKWKSTGEDGQGFIAHELAEICPDAVIGKKDAVDEEGNPIYQMVDTSFLVATLTAAIQELKAELDATKAEVAALKGVN